MSFFALETRAYDTRCEALADHLAELQAELQFLSASGPTATTCEHAPIVCAEHNARVQALEKAIGDLEPQMAQCQAKADADALCRAQLERLLTQLKDLETPNGPTAIKCEDAPDICAKRSKAAAAALAAFQQAHGAEINQLRDSCGSDFSALIVNGVAPERILEVSDLNGANNVTNPSQSIVNVADQSGPRAACNSTALEEVTAEQVANGTYAKGEWRPLLDGGNELSTKNGFGETEVALSGTVVNPKVSNGDIPFTHPFGFDYEFMIAPDQQYLSLLAKSNSGPGGEFGDGVAAAAALGLTVPGVVGVELDQGMIPPEFRLPHGARVGVYGRWIIDCGHTDFHSEIHPPLLTTAAVPRGDDLTVSVAIGRPYLGTQSFLPDGTDFISRLKAQFILEFSGCQFLPPGVPCIIAVSVREIMERPFSGKKQLAYVVRPPSGRKYSADQLMVREHFTVRQGVSVSLKTVADGVVVLVTMDASKYNFLPLTQYHRNADYVAGNATYDVLLQAIKVLEQQPELKALAFVHTPDAISLGYDQYDLPTMTGFRRFDLTTLEAIDLPAMLDVTVNDNQPWPVFGRLEVYWIRHPMMADPQ